MLSAFLLLSVTPTLALWPVPEKVSTGDHTLWLRNNVSVSYNGEAVCYTPPSVNK